MKYRNLPVPRRGRQNSSLSENKNVKVEGRPTWAGKLGSKERERGLVSRGRHRLGVPVEYVFLGRVFMFFHFSFMSFQLHDLRALMTYDTFTSRLSSSFCQTKRLRSDGRLAPQSSGTGSPVEVRESLGFKSFCFGVILCFMDRVLFSNLYVCLVATC